MFRFILIVLVLVLALGVFNARFGGVSNGRAEMATLTALAANPARYEGQAVTLKGRVEGRMSLFGLGGFRITDASGLKLVVVGATPPGPGTELTVTGTYFTAFALGDVTAPVLVVGR